MNKLFKVRGELNAYGIDEESYLFDTATTERYFHSSHPWLFAGQYGINMHAEKVLRASKHANFHGERLFGLNRRLGD